MTGSPGPFKRGTKIFRRLRQQPISPFWLVRWSGPLKHFGPPEGVGGAQGLHLGPLGGYFCPDILRRGRGKLGDAEFGMAKCDVEKIWREFENAAAKCGTKPADGGTRTMVDREWWLPFPAGLWLVAVISFTHTHTPTPTHPLPLASVTRPTPGTTAAAAGCAPRCTSPAAARSPAASTARRC